MLNLMVELVEPVTLIEHEEDMGGLLWWMASHNGTAICSQHASRPTKHIEAACQNMVQNFWRNIQVASPQDFPIFWLLTCTPTAVI